MCVCAIDGPKLGASAMIPYKALNILQVAASSLAQGSVSTSHRARWRFLPCLKASQSDKAPSATPTGAVMEAIRSLGLLSLFASAASEGAVVGLASESVACEVAPEETSAPRRFLQL
jgi:hypothetical protein